MEIYQIDTKTNRPLCNICGKPILRQWGVCNDCRPEQQSRWQRNIDERIKYNKYLKKIIKHKQQYAREYKKTGTITPIGIMDDDDPL